MATKHEPLEVVDSSGLTDDDWAKNKPASAPSRERGLHSSPITSRNNGMCRSSDSWGNMASPQCIGRQIGIYDWSFGCTRALNFIAVSD
jgi:hypothetical protein